MAGLQGVLMERTKRTLKEERTMTTYEIRQPHWSVPEGEKALTLYTFKSGQDFVAYTAIRAKAQERITLYYDKGSDIMYVED